MSKTVKVRWCLFLPERMSVAADLQQDAQNRHSKSVTDPEGQSFVVLVKIKFKCT